jgi:hypothetical protein
VWASSARLWSFEARGPSNDVSTALQTLPAADRQRHSPRELAAVHIDGGQFSPGRAAGTAVTVSRCLGCYDYGSSDASLYSY